MFISSKSGFPNVQDINIKFLEFLQTSCMKNTFLMIEKIYTVALLRAVAIIDIKVLVCKTS